jgi:hypothetical protein
MDATPPAWPLSRIVEYARRPRHNHAGADRICAWIRELGFKVACLVRSDQEMVDGPPSRRPRAGWGRERSQATRREDYNRERRT